MKKFFKGLLTVAALAGISYAGYKAYSRINEVMKISKTLPDYLFDLLGEKPRIDINQKLGSLSIAVGLSSEAYESLEIDLEDYITNYIADYYPNIANLKLTITKYIKASKVPSDDSADCVCDCNETESEE
ncbi:MAG: hypothetical protein FWG20_06465 [Candidatus Cloacimonetes bacterium]|nr:hypothetical protein [Candidatus Cloacimonadota bacterium]